MRPIDSMCARPKIGTGGDGMALADGRRMALPSGAW